MLALLHKVDYGALGCQYCSWDNLAKVYLETKETKGSEHTVCVQKCFFWMAEISLCKTFWGSESMLSTEATSGTNNVFQIKEHTLFSHVGMSFIPWTGEESHGRFLSSVIIGQPAGCLHVTAGVNHSVLRLSASDKQE